MTASILSIRDLYKRYGKTESVRHISFDVHEGEVVGLLGPNGAGKTTTINAILGVLTPSGGTISIEGVPITERRTEALNHTNFAAVYSPLPGNLTVCENLRIFGLLYRVKQLRQRIEELLELFSLQAFRNTKCGVLSSGEQTRVSLAKALINRPRLLLLDEPTASLDPATAHDIRARIRNYVRDTGASVLWTSHNMLEVQEVCDRVLFLSRGRVLLEGNPKTLPAEHGQASLDALFIHLAHESLNVEAA